MAANPTFADIEFKPHPIGNGIMGRVCFDNGYTASVVRFHGSYGNEDGLYELAVMRNGRLDYTTAITNDVLGHLSESDVSDTLAQIAALPPAT